MIGIIIPMPMMSMSMVAKIKPIAGLLLDTIKNLGENTKETVIG